MYFSTKEKRSITTYYSAGVVVVNSEVVALAPGSMSTTAAIIALEKTLQTAAAF
jgi:hypothetical protein